MSEENVELVRQGYELFNRTGEIDPSMYHPDFEFQDFGEAPLPVRKGIEGWQRWTRDVTEAFEDFSLEPADLLDLGDRVLALIVMRAHGRGSRVPMEIPLAVLWTVRDGKVAKCQLFRDKGEAVEAAGLSE